MKTGRIDRAYFQGKFGVDVVERFAEPLRKLESQDLLEIGEGELRLTRGGLLRVDQLLPEFYAPDYRDSRYT
jgi:oxygen-independent coproporphyrinogen-3 oxidase